MSTRAHDLTRMGMPRRVIRSIARRVVKAFQDNGLGTYASAIAFQLVTAVVPLALFAFGIVGFLNLQEIWTRDLAPTVKESVSGPAYQLLDQTLRDVLTHKRFEWVTIGALLAVWQLSGAVRASMGALDVIYGARRRRSLRETLTRSLWLSAAGALLVFACIAVVAGAPLVYGDVGPVAGVLLFLVRWAIGGALLLLAVGLLVQFGPTKPQPVGWTSVGSVLVVVAWALTSIGFALYLQLLAGGSLFGHLFTVVVAIAYFYAASIAFLVGVQTDAVLRARAGDAPGPSRRGTSKRSKRPSRPVART
jgi:membrane protein